MQFLNLPSKKTSQKTLRMAKQVTVTEYQTRVYTLLKQIPEGKVSTYRDLSKALSSSPRAVGGALRRNPFAPKIPCHRVIGANGVRYKSLRHPTRAIANMTIRSTWAAFKVTGRKRPVASIVRENYSSWQRKGFSSMLEG